MHHRFYDVQPPEEVYLPEDYYWQNRDFDRARAALVTLEYLSQWADKYEVYPHVHNPENRHEGTLPSESDERKRLVDREFAWLIEQDKYPALLAFNLTRGEDTLIDQHDGIPGPMILTPQQFAHLQDEWQQNGLPRDLYYRQGEDIVGVEAVEIYGGRVRVHKRYTPLQWRERQGIAIEELPVPTEEERAEALVAACAAFAAVLARRLYELMEPGRERDEKLMAIVATLAGAAHKLSAVTKGGDRKKLDEIIESFAQLSKSSGDTSDSSGHSR